MCYFESVPYVITGRISVIYNCIFKSTDYEPEYSIFYRP